MSEMCLSWGLRFWSIFHKITGCWILSFFINICMVQFSVLNFIAMQDVFIYFKDVHVVTSKNYGLLSLINFHIFTFTWIRLCKVNSANCFLIFSRNTVWKLDNQLNLPVCYMCHCCGYCNHLWDCWGGGLEQFYFFVYYFRSMLKLVFAMEQNLYVKHKIQALWTLTIHSGMSG
jgi:hypothetical protein